LVNVQYIDDIYIQILLLLNIYILYIYSIYTNLLTDKKYDHDIKVKN